MYKGYFKDAFVMKLWGTLDARQCAKIHLLRVMQKQRFSDEISYLLDPRNKQIPDLVANLNLFFDKFGILRSDGRMGKVTEFDYDLINPILLAKDHHLTTLIIEDCHNKCQHLGIRATLERVRLAGFWIPKARQAVKNVISPCFMCKRFNSLAFKYPKVTNLPKHRVNMIKPFRHVGIDYTGAVKVREKQGDEPSDMYILIFTCLTIRAIHIELVSSMNVSQLILAFIRFTNIYGIPSHLYSDNAKSFIAGGDILKEVFRASEFQERFSKYNIKHVRIPSYSAWVGSTWERMIRVIKSCLHKVVGRSVIDYFKLLTVLSDVVNAVNCRPLTYRCADDAGLEIISPNCFIKPYVNDSLLFSSESESIINNSPPCRKDVVKTLSSRDKMLSYFRKLWYQDYLLSLREQCKDLHELDFENKVKVNDVVLIKGPPSEKRPFWKLGRVVELIPGDDGKVRSCKLKRADGEYLGVDGSVRACKGEISHHSLNHLYPLELSLTHAYNALQPVNLDNANKNLNVSMENTGENLDEPLQAIVDSETGNDSADIELLVSNNSNEPFSGSIDDLIIDHTFSDRESLNDSEEHRPVDESVDQLTQILESNYDSVGHEQITDHVNLNTPEQINEQEIGTVGTPNIEIRSRRSRRVASAKSRPMDNQFVYF